MEEKLITVILAVYNGEKFLREQIESILNQTYKKIELLIFDDCSTDKSREIVKEYTKKYAFIKLHINSRRFGVVKNFENALKQSNGRYIALADQDDIWHKDKLKILMQKMLEAERVYKNTPILVHSDLEMIDEHGNLLHNSYFKFKGYFLPDDKSVETIVSQNGVMGNTILMNENLKKILFPFPEYLNVHDYWIALINELFGKRITVKMPLVKYRLHTKNCSNKIDLFKNKSKLFLFFIKLPYRGINREKVLRELLKRFELSQEDKKVIKEFLIYLEFSSTKLYIFYAILKYGFIKKVSRILYKLTSD
ncbi:glycosyltransferase family 2 protein [Hydrogenimonas thermophila]|uniref:glycosyltransferase family 2 protein n=1 Tax=Hydrogenimonas thermophila TaxID=223786 RepID=UPI002936FDDA|nr:glycosyltransferase family 2 protein [Hydrogenimonas thermophila]WOE69454.1 glycosyltransferase family 2 protein [Hydrogenimonas thermophila]WOE71965.1 glycosyltransferase family 2 protein [Hydrogenimonas thermophila]